MVARTKGISYLMTPQEVGDYLHMSRGQVYENMAEWVAKGWITGIIRNNGNPKGELRFIREEIERLPKHWAIK